MKLKLELKYKNQFGVDAILRHTKKQNYASSRNISWSKKKKRRKEK